MDDALCDKYLIGKDDGYTWKHLGRSGVVDTVDLPPTTIDDQTLDRVNQAGDKGEELLAGEQVESVGITHTCINGLIV